MSRESLQKTVSCEKFQTVCEVLADVFIPGSNIVALCDTDDVNYTHL